MIEGQGQPSRSSYDAVIIGAGFFGCALAERLARDGLSVLVCEMGTAAMERASAVNQARVHAGFHYPRSFATAQRSLHNFERFAQEYGPAVRRDFRMLYAIARYRTKVNARRFEGMFTGMGAPIERATAAQRSLFSSELVEDVFSCSEYAFDYSMLRALLFERLRDLPVEIVFAARVERVERTPGGVGIRLDGGGLIEADQVLNITYSQLNSLLRASHLPTLDLKHELVEIALIDPPADLDGVAITVMDGAFFSTMPYPSASAYSLTHVRYTPHFGWTDDTSLIDAYETAKRLPQKTRWLHMVNDSKRYVPSLDRAVWRGSLFDTKTVPVRNERDDGRPILLHRHEEIPGFASVLGSKIDNIFDLFDAVKLDRS